MTLDGTELPRCPRAIALAMRPLPLPVLGVALTQFARRVTDSHPGLLRRLGPYAQRTVLIDPTDLPFAFWLDPEAGPRISAHRRRRAPAADARIAGPVAALIGMLHGRFDGDALFFSRDLTIEGDTEAVLALRNALDDAELDLSEELIRLSGPAGALLRRLLAGVERVSGLPLHRDDRNGGFA